MQFWIDVRPSADEKNIEVRFLDSASPAGGLGSPARVLPILGAAPAQFPAPLPGDTAGLPDTLQNKLLLAPGADALEACLKRMAKRERHELAPLGRYLFVSLFGQNDEAWPAIVTCAKNEPIELSFRFHEKVRFLARLPWEMMHDGTGFLARLPQLSFVRRVELPASPLPAAASLEAPPRVLFVVGVRPSDPSIRAGAEYLAVLRSVTCRQLPLQTQLVVVAPGKKTGDPKAAQASQPVTGPGQVELALKSFRPHVVHFICHGSTKDGRGALDIGDPSGNGDRAKNGAEIAAVLSAGGPLPAVVVLNACDSAGSFMDVRSSSTLAEDLTRAGVPIVVGMSGEVADDACRWFSRRLYEALVEDGDVARAVAEGRRYGLLHSPDSGQTVDWALPSLYMSGSLSAAPAPQRFESERKWLDCAGRYVAADEYPPFCGRLDLGMWFDLLMAPEEVQKACPLVRGSGLQFLAIASNPDETSVPEGYAQPQYGRHRTLRELAVMASRAGHLPCQIPPPANDTFEGLLEAWKVAALDTAMAFDIAWGWSHLVAVESGPPALPDTFPPKLQELYSSLRGHPRVKAAAACFDLLKLVDAANATYPRVSAEARKLLLLIDDAHLLGSALDQLLGVMFGKGGLRLGVGRIAVAFSYSRSKRYEPVVAPITSWLKEPSAHVLDLERFEAGEDLVAYQSYLLGRREHGAPGGAPQPLVVSDAEHREAFLRKVMPQYAYGVPSWLPRVDKVIGTLLDFPPGKPMLRVAKDEEILRQIKKERAS